MTLLRFVPSSRRGAHQEDTMVLSPVWKRSTKASPVPDTTKTVTALRITTKMPMGLTVTAPTMPARMSFRSWPQHRTRLRALLASRTRAPSQAVVPEVASASERTPCPSLFTRRTTTFAIPRPTGPLAAARWMQDSRMWSQRTMLSAHA